MSEIMETLDSPEVTPEGGAADDLSALSWVSGELRRSLEAAHKALRRHQKESDAARGSDLGSVDPSILRAARVQLHQGMGALEMVGMPQAARLLAASEAAVQRMMARPGMVDAAAVETIEKSSFALLDYLGRKLARKDVSPVMLFPQYRAVQTLAAAGRVHPADLWPMPWQWHDLPGESRITPRAANDTARGAMETRVLTLMRQTPGDAGKDRQGPSGAAREALMQMSDLCAQLGAGASESSFGGPEVATFWRLAAAVFEAQATGLLQADTYSKRLASGMLTQLRLSIRGHAELPQRLAQDLLFFCAHAQAPSTPAVSPRLAAVRAAWNLDAWPTADYDTARLGRYDPAVLAQARKRVAAAKDSWSAVAGGEMHRLGGLPEQFSLMGESLQRLFPEGETLAQALSLAVTLTVAGGVEPQPALAMEVATALLYVDASLEDAQFDHPELAERVRHLARRIDEVRIGAGPQPLESWMEELYRRVSDRQTMGSVVQELRASLSEIEKQIDQYFRQPSRRELLIPVPGQLSSMRGVLSVLGMDQASNAALHMRDDVEALAQTEVDPQMAVRAGTFDRLADNLGALSFLIDMLAVQPQLAKSLFRFDPETGSLSAVMGQSERVSAFAEFDDGVPRESATRPGPLDATQPVPTPIPKPGSASVAPMLPVPAATIDTGLEDDVEMREIFIEEAREVISDAQAALERLADVPDNAGDLTTVRRAFHTLKGSARMIGLREFGEAGWACEQLYNDRLAIAPRMDSPLRAFTADALGYLAGWTEAIALGQSRGHRAADVAQPADSLRLRGERLPVQAPGGSVEVPFGVAGSTGVVAPAAAPAVPAGPSVLPDNLPSLDDWLSSPGVAGPQATPAVQASPDAGFEATVTLPPAVPPAPQQPAGMAELDFDLLEEAEPVEQMLPVGGTLEEHVPDLPSADDLDLRTPRLDVPPTQAVPVPELTFDLDLNDLDLPEVFEGAPAPPAAPAWQVADSQSLLNLPLDLPSDQPVGESAAGWSDPDAETQTEISLRPAAPLPTQIPEGEAIELGLGHFDGVFGVDEGQPPVSPELIESVEPPLEPAVEPAVEPSIEPSVEAVQSPGSAVPLEDPEPAEPATSPAAVEPLTAEEAPDPSWHAPGGAAEDADEDQDQVKIIGPLRIGIPLFNIYLNEADELSRRLVTELAEWSLESDRHPVPESAMVLAHSLAGSSATVGYAELSALARALEHALMRSHTQARGREGEATLFNEVAEEIRRVLHQFAAGFLRSVSADLMERLADHERWPVDSAGGPPSVRDDLEHPQPEAIPEAAGAEPDAIDEELFPIFEEEADELLPQLQTRLSEWLKSPGEPDAAMACMRTLHTLKGGARLAGAMRIGEMAHGLETAIEALGDGGSPRRIDIEPLLARADAMSGAFDGLRRRGAAPGVAPAAVPVPAPVAAPVVPASVPVSLPVSGSLAVPRPPLAASDPQVAAASESPVDRPRDPDVMPDVPMVAEAEADRAAALTAPVPAPTVTVDSSPSAAGHLVLAPDAVDWSRFAVDEGAMTAAPLTERGVAGGAVVRVRAGLLDRLVNQAGEVSITRARIDADVRQLQNSLGDLTDSMERMRRQLRDIEVQAETQITTRIEAAKAAAEEFDPLEMDRFTRFQELTRFMAESVNDVATLQRSLQRTLQSTEDQLAAQARLTRELQDDLLRTRMIEFDSISERLFRTARQAAKETGKQVKVEIVGGAIEVDRGVLERMAGSFEHLLRNSVAHGVEKPEARSAAGKDVVGTITITVAQAGNEVAVEFADDGGGLDLDRIRQRGVERGLLSADVTPSEAELAGLIFAPGFSTAETVTELAGRGVGLDVVRAEVNAMGGRVETASKPGQGTRFKLLLPLTTAVTQVVMMRCGDLQVAVPSPLVEIVRRVPTSDVLGAYADGRLSYDGESVPFFWLAALLRAGSRGETPGRTQTVVIVRSAAQRVAIHIDEVIGNQEVVVKNVGPQLARLPGLAGVTLLPSGAVALIYNPVALSSLYGDEARERQRQIELAPEQPHAEAALLRAPLVMVVDDSLTVRRITQRLLLREGYRVVLAKDGLDALERLAQERPAVLLSDIEMPRMDGFDLVRNVRSDQALAGLPVVMITSRIAQKHREYAAELGVQHYLGKPYSEDELLGLVAQYTRVQPA